MKPTMKELRQEAGFTLVELAVVMIIIGLLIGGILKGQELINNAQVSSTIAEIKSFDSSVSGFRDQFNAFPGDMLTAQAAARVPNCAGVAVCTFADAGNRGNGQIDDVLLSGAQAASIENTAAWVQLNNANFIAGVDGTPANTQWGQLQPDSAMGRGGYGVAYHPGGNLAAGDNGVNIANPGHFIVLTLTPNVAPVGFLRATQAARIDRKMDDGNAETGNVRALGSDVPVGGVYAEAAETVADIIMVMGMSG